MLLSGHYGAALLLYAPAGLLLLSYDPALAVLGGAGAVGLSRLLDCDLRVPIVDHRGATHSLAFLVLVAAALGWFGHLAAGALGTASVRTAFQGVVVGTVAVGSHLLADVLTPSGVALLWPLTRRRYALSLAAATDPLANLGLFGLGVAATVAVGYVVGGCESGLIEPGRRIQGRGSELGSDVHHAPDHRRSPGREAVRINVPKHPFRAGFHRANL